MRRIITIIPISIAAILFVTIFTVFGQTTPDTPTYPPPQHIFTANNSQGILNQQALFIFGPYICTSYGDPYSPSNSRFTDEHPYTYDYQIIIPPDYPDDVLRIELFDPDSINQDGQEADISFTQLAIDNGFSSTPITRSCPDENDNSRINTCIITTNEADLLQTVPGIESAHINPMWYLRVDENRGSGQPGRCAIPEVYSPQYNTETLFRLFYARQNDDGSIEHIPLANYTGQVGDNMRDLGEHQTDLRWVSPGGTPSFDQPAFVPVDPGTPINPATGSPYSFELNIARDLPNIVVDPVTGNRIVNLEVISLPTGGSQNTFAIWAGPDDDIDTVPSEVNARNLYQLNTYGQYHSQGVPILGPDVLPIQTLTDQDMDIPLAYIGPEYAGKTVYIDHFDLDKGIAPPINFYFDTLAYTPDDSENGFDENQTDWSVAHGFSGDPYYSYFANPQTSNDSWVNYAITLPTDLECTGSDPEQCTPFYGGTLTARVQIDNPDGLSYDNHVWQMRHSSLQEPWDNTNGCTAFPIGIREDNRSVLPPGESGANSWRETFDYPSQPPNYYSFINHRPNLPLQNAQPGTLYIIPAYFPTFLAWNVCSNSSSDLTASLTWPGNNKDYTPTAGTCGPTGGSVVPGYIEAGDPTDTNMQIGDWIALSTGVVNTSGTRDVLEEHIDLDRVLRLPVWYDQTGSGANAAVKVSRFGLFRIVGHGLSQGGGGSFIMVEFIDWDDSCGQSATAISDLTLDGPSLGLVNTSYTFTATVSPIDVTLPITVVWSATDAATVTYTNQLETSHPFQWVTSGTKTITVTAQNANEPPVTTTHQITIQEPANLIIGSLTLVADPPLVANKPVTFSIAVTNTGDIAVGNSFFVDIFVNPTEVHDDSIPIDQSKGYATVSSLAPHASTVVTLTVADGLPADRAEHIIYGMVDGQNTILESDETDNLSAPLTLTMPPLPIISLANSCVSTPQANLSLSGLNWPNNEDVNIFFGNDLHTTLLAGHGGTFSTSWAETIIIGQDYEITAVSPSYTVTTTLTTPCLPAAPTSVSISGLANGKTGESYTFIAAVNSETAVQPITYTWTVSDANPIIQTGDLSERIAITWNTPGPKHVFLRVENAYGSATTTHIIDIAPYKLFIPIIAKPNE